MAAYENHEPPEGINVSPVHPLKEFALLLGGLFLVIVVAFFVLSFLSGYLVRFVPFAQEKALVPRIDTDRLKAKKNTQDTQRENYLQGLAARYADAPCIMLPKIRSMPLPAVCSFRSLPILFFSRNSFFLV